jgi:hypothetical protein
MFLLEQLETLETIGYTEFKEILIANSSMISSREILHCFVTL